ncbi:MAG: Undecaprenyl-phosphate mannosyltransferase [Candidatus Heimdallarchaeota archaeon LC_2]|nr:MAG: Undecaprenyl-phosphate mannosyltransferase [Candidatus Heimdallarchaeota archaeon LC_2]
MEAKDLTIIIPTLNEEANIGRLCDEIVKLLPEINIIVVDDGSTDTTQEIVKEKNDQVKLLDRKNEPVHGLTISIVEGIKSCITPNFMVIDGDFQHPPESLMDAYDCFQKNGDIVIGYRVKVEDWPFTRKLMSFTAQVLAYFSLLLRRRQRPKDIMSGFFGGKVDMVAPLLESDKLALKGYKLLFDLLKILPRDAKIEQFGYIFKSREFGDSKIGKTQIWEFFKSIF